MNPWRLQAWLGHKRIDETMLYVHVAEAHPRELPKLVRQASRVGDPDKRVLAMLGARGTAPTTNARKSMRRGNAVAKTAVLELKLVAAC